MERVSVPGAGLAPVAVLSLAVGVVAMAAIFLSLSGTSPQAEPHVLAIAPGSNPTIPQATSSSASSEAVPVRAIAAEPPKRVRPVRQQIIIQTGGGQTETSSEPAKVPVGFNPSSSPQEAGDENGDEVRVWPRLKPRHRPAGAPVVHAIDPSARYLAPSEPLAFATADDFTGGRETLFAEYAQARLRDREERAYMTVVLTRGDSLASTLEAVGGQPDHIAALLSAADEVSPISKLEPGTAVDYAFDTIFIEPDLEAAKTAAEPVPALPVAESVMARLRFRPDARHIVTAWRQSDGSYLARNEEVDVDKRYAAVGGVIRHSLFAAAARSDVPPEIMVRFANLFLFDVDFARDIHKGDRFETVYEVYYDTQGQYVGTGDIVFAGMTWAGDRHAKGYYRFEGVEGMEVPYFDASGESANRLLMKTPIEGARVTSAFGKRRHPILGYQKDHLGVDFGAPKGTPIMAAGDGKVIRAEMAGSWGNFVRIEHAHGYVTSYAHLNGFAKGLRKGKTVRQGDIIGYVGATGRATGAHLHYEVHKSDKVQNPMTLKVANGRVLDNSAMTEFGERRGYVDSIRVRPLTVAAATIE